MASSTVNDIEIKFHADAKTAVDALKQIQTATNSVHQRITALSRAASGANTSLKSLDNTLTLLKQGTAGDILGLKGVERRISKVNTLVKKFNKTANSAATTFDNRLKSVDKTIDRIFGKFKMKVNLFGFTKDTDRKIDRLDKLLLRMETEAKNRRALIAEELKLVKERQNLNVVEGKLQQRMLTTQKKLTKEEGRRIATYTQALKQQAHYLGALGSADKGFGKHVSTLRTSLIMNTRSTNRNTAATNKNSIMVARLPRMRGGGYDGRYHESYALLGTTAMVADYGVTFAKSAFEQIAKLQERQARVQAWGLNVTDQATWNLQTERLLKENNLITKAEAESMMMAAASSIGHYDPKIVGGTVSQVTKYAQLERAMGYNKSEPDDIAKNYYGVAEARQVADDIAKTLNTFKTIFQITTTTSGKITVADVETILRNMGPGAATISDEGLLRLLAYAEQIKIAGRGSSGSTGAGISTVGTNVKMLQLMAMGKPSAIGAKKMMAELGIMEDELYEKVGENFAIKAANNAEGLIARRLLGDTTITADDRGTYDQLKGTYFLKGGRNLARAGAYNKQLAQEDPVKWVETMIPLIKHYTASDRKQREIYYGSDLAEKYKDLDPEEFIKKVGETATLSATQSFWAKTGLSQRVLTGLTTFSNEAFIRRSTHMMETAQHQKSAEDLMKEQYEKGNLNIAMLRFTKAIENLYQSFEPFGSTIAKLTFKIADAIDVVSKWVREWQTLANATATWVGLKTITALLQNFANSYALFAGKRDGIRSGGSYGRKDSGYNSPLAGFIIDKSHGAKRVLQKKAIGEIRSGSVAGLMMGSAYHMKNVVSKTGGMLKDTATDAIRLFGAGISKAFGAIGFGIMVADFGSMLLDMAAQYTTWGKEFKAWWENLVDNLSKSEFVLNLRFGDKLDSSLDSAEKRGLEERIKEKKRELAELEEVQAGSTVDSDENHYARGQKIHDLTQEIIALKEELKAVSKRGAEKVHTNYSDLDNITSEVMKSIGLGENEIDDKYKIVDFEAKKLQKMISIAGTSPTKENAEAVKEQYEVVKKASEAFGESVNKFSQSVSGQVDSFVKINEIIKSIESPEIRESLTKAVLDKFGMKNADNQALAMAYARQRKDIPFQSFFLSNEFARTFPGLEALSEAVSFISSHFRTVVGKDGTKKEVFTNVINANKKDVLETYWERKAAQLAKLRSDSTQRGEFASMDEIREEAKQDFIKEVISGKFARQGKNPFIREDRRATESGIFTAEDVDLSLVDEKTKRSGNSFVEQGALIKQAEYFNKNFGTILKKTGKALTTAQNEAIVALNSMNKVDDAKASSTARLNRLEAIKEQQSQFEESGATTYQSDIVAKAMRNMKVSNFYGTLQETAGASRGYADQAQSLRRSMMTRDQRLIDEYNEESAILEEQRKAKLKQLEEDMTAAVESGTEDRLEIEKKYRIAVDQVEQQYNNLQTQRQRQHQEELTGYHEKHLKEIAEDWSDIGDEIEHFQSEMMDGFVDATTRWLDGDLNSWRDYANNLIKIIREMVIKKGMAPLLEMMTDGVSGGIHSFINGAFGIQQKDADGNPTAPSLMHQIGQGVTGWIPNALFGQSGNVTAPSSMTGGIMPGLLNPAMGIGAQMAYNSQFTNTGANIVGGAMGGLSGSNPFENMDLMTSSLNTFQQGLTTGATNLDLFSIASTAGTTATNALNAASIGLTATEETGQAIKVITQGLDEAGNVATTQETTSTFALIPAIKAASLALYKLAASASTSGGGGGAGIAGSIAGSIASGVSVAANGGIIGSSGHMPLKMYSNGGIAKKAQVAVFGEGSKPEAYVPLPDGRSIPVTMNVNSNKEASGGNNFSISINVVNNADKSESTTQEGDPSGDVTNLKKFANNIKAIVKNEIVTQSRPGGLLYNAR